MDGERQVGAPTDLGVRLVWAYLRALRSAGDDNPLDWRYIRREIESLRERGVPVPEGDEWWR